MKIKGTLLKFDVLNANGSRVSKDCKINIPEKVPLCYDFNFDVNHILGNCAVERTDEGLIFEGNINEKTPIDMNALLKSSDIRGIGGYYTNVKSHFNNKHERVVDNMNLKSCSITLSPVHPDYKFEILSEDMNETI